MKPAPQAGFTITIFTDEEYRILMSTDIGERAFAVFTAMVILGRERMNAGKAKNSRNSSLQLENGLNHLCALSGVRPESLASGIQVFADLAEQVGGEPWMYLDGEPPKLVIRSFFKFNGGNHGGSRQGAGRPKKGIQDIQVANQAEFKRIQANSSGFQDGPPSCARVGIGDSPYGELKNLSLSPPTPSRMKLSESESDFAALKIADPPGDPLTDPDPAWRDPTPERPLGPIGSNSAADVKLVYETAERLWPLEGMSSHAAGWLMTYPARRIIDAMATTAGKKIGAPARYIAVILQRPERADASPSANGKPPPKQPEPYRPPPAPEVTPEERERMIARTGEFTEELKRRAAASTFNKKATR